MRQVTIDATRSKCMPPPQKCIGLAMTLTLTSEPLTFEHNKFQQCVSTIVSSFVEMHSLSTKIIIVSREIDVNVSK